MSRLVREQNGRKMWRSNQSSNACDVMSLEETQKQTPGQLSAAKHLSRPKGKPPCDIPGYDLDALLGRGAYGEVWVATAQNTGRRVAIKIYHHRGALDESVVSAEVEKLVFLSADRYVVQLLEVGWNSEPPYYVMEYLPNGSLEDQLRRGGAMQIEDAIHIFKDVVIGLLHAHGKGIFHCDLKPANILLDQDGKARIADFGQSRLSNDQRPALGTLFFMAPEQADIEATPDVRWDVYALGALLYTMLVGEPPFRSSSSVGEIDSTSGLRDRLQKYRELIANSPPPENHKKIRGIDRELIQIIDRAISVNPRHRYHNVQEVYDALNERERNRYRRPLLVLGILGPAVLLTIGLLFGWQNYKTAMATSEGAMISKAHESNQFAAELAATNVSSAIGQRFEEVERLADDPEFLDLYLNTIYDPELKELLDRLHEVRATGADQTPDRIAFQQHPNRQALQDRIRAQFELPSQKNTASWFVVDAHGFHIASSFDADPAVSPIGGYFGYRTYFQGGAADLSPTAPTPEPINETHLSAVFRSTASGTWKVAMSTPLRTNGKLVGIVAMSIDVGKFTSLEPAEHQFAVLVDGRDAPTHGVILQHPLYDKLLENREMVPIRFSEEDQYRVKLDQFQSNQPVVGKDPIGHDKLGQEYNKPWIFAAKDVVLPQRKGQVSSDPQSTGLVVVVQEDHGFAVKPIHELGKQLSQQAMLAVSLIILVVLTLWYFVVRALRRVDVGAVATGDSSSVIPPHEMPTIVAPVKTGTKS
ncbi:protein kinase domain-containing protein [Bremerella sp. T1]|uniref:serine/threonine protein kinase n=1 Tax=Bremerella sp. TYQ1 TaxID=3119568 RepID=UPI001CCCFCFA|nr:protein kinase [Bremerella volcania]UBM35711.1 protein kinase [Bremerella volcania]